MSSDPSAPAIERVKITTWRNAIRHPRGPATPTQRHVLLTAATFSSRTDEAMFMGIECLSAGTGLHRETVRRALDACVRDGWVLRRPRKTITGNTISDARLVGYVYAAAVPAGWIDANGGAAFNQWRDNPQYVSERAKRPRSKQGHVPTVDRDARSTDVPVLSGDVPVVCGVVPVLSGDVPAQDRMNSYLNRSLTYSEQEARAPAGDPRGRRRAEPEAERLRRARALVPVVRDAEKIATSASITIDQAHAIIAEAVP